MTTVFRYRPRDVITASLSDEVFQFYASLRVLQLYHLDGVEDIWVFFTDCNLMSFAVQFDSIGTRSIVSAKVKSIGYKRAYQIKKQITKTRA